VIAAAAAPASGGSVLFVCSTPLHVALFAEVMRAAGFRAQGLAPVVVADHRPDTAGRLDRALAGLDAGVPVVRMAPVSARGGSFAARVRARWELVAGGGVVEDLMERLRPRACVVGNDAAYLERLVLSAARRRGIRTVLVQDGLFPRRPRAGLTGLAGAALDAALAAMGAGVLASGRYGAAGCDAVAAMGPAFRDALIAHGAPPASVTVTGAPLFERGRERATAEARRAVRARLGVPPEAVLIAYFTTNILTELGDRAGHALQLAEIESLAAALPAALPGGALAVKLHPMDRVEDHPLPGLTLAPLDLDAGELVHAADAVATSFSAVLVEAAARGRPCLVPAVHLSASPWMRVVRDLGVMPLATPAALAAALAELATPAGRERAAAAARRGDLIATGPIPAAEAVAALIAGPGA